jgi:hypothetical protein
MYGVRAAYAECSEDIYLALKEHQGDSQTAIGREGIYPGMLR